jgi:thiamine-phosphate pyrophosphorylase
MQNKVKRGIYRVIDANLNRAKEGLRVCEEVFRFILPDRGLSNRFKKIRHLTTDVIRQIPVKKTDLLTVRNSDSDIGRVSSVLELKRNDFKDIFFANIQRSKESIRVLEEFCKLLNQKKAQKIKELRYAIYDAEKKAVKKIETLHHYR